MVTTRKYKGIKNAVTEIKLIADNHKGIYYQVSYDVDNDQVITTWHTSFGYNEWDEYNDPNIIHIGFFDQDISMRALKRKIIEAIDEKGL